MNVDTCLRCRPERRSKPSKRWAGISSEPPLFGGAWLWNCGAACPSESLSESERDGISFRGLTACLYAA